MKNTVINDEGKFYDVSITNTQDNIVTENKPIPFIVELEKGNTYLLQHKDGNKDYLIEAKIINASAFAYKISFNSYTQPAWYNKLDIHNNYLIIENITKFVDETKL